MTIAVVRPRGHVQSTKTLQPIVGTWVRGGVTYCVSRGLLETQHGFLVLTGTCVVSCESRSMYSFSRRYCCPAWSVWCGTCSSTTIYWPLTSWLIRSSHATRLDPGVWVFCWERNSASVSSHLTLWRYINFIIMYSYYYYYYKLNNVDSASPSAFKTRVNTMPISEHTDHAWITHWLQYKFILGRGERSRGRTRREASERQGEWIWWGCALPCLGPPCFFLIYMQMCTFWFLRRALSNLGDEAKILFPQYFVWGRSPTRSPPRDRRLCYNVT